MKNLKDMQRMAVCVLTVVAVCAAGLMVGTLLHWLLMLMPVWGGVLTLAALGLASVYATVRVILDEVLSGDDIHIDYEP